MKPKRLLTMTSMSARTRVFASAISNQQCPAISDSSRVNIIVISRDPWTMVGSGWDPWVRHAKWPLMINVRSPTRVRTIIAGSPQPRNIGVHVFFCLSAPWETNIFGDSTWILLLSSQSGLRERQGLHWFWQTFKRWTPSLSNQKWFASIEQLYIIQLDQGYTSRRRSDDLF